MHCYYLTRYLLRFFVEQNAINYFLLKSTAIHNKKKNNYYGFVQCTYEKELLGNSLETLAYKQNRFKKLVKVRGTIWNGKNSIGQFRTRVKRSPRRNNGQKSISKGFSAWVSSATEADDYRSLAVNNNIIRYIQRCFTVNSRQRLFGIDDIYTVYEKRPLENCRETLKIPAFVRK